MSLPLIHLAEVDSTQAFLRRHRELGFCAVLADAQLEGRGRQGNAWISAAGAGLWLSAALPRGRSIADQLLEHAHPWIQRALDPALAVEALPRLFQHYHKGGVVRLDEVGPDRAVLDLWAFVPYPGWHDLLLPSVLRRALERCGAEAVQVRILPEGPEAPSFHHRYELTWRKAMRT